MKEVRSSPYREPVTPQGLKKIEEGTLDYFDPEIYTNFNTGVLEQYLEEKNRVESFERSHFNLKKVLLMIEQLAGTYPSRRSDKPKDGKPEGRLPASRFAH